MTIPEDHDHLVHHARLLFPGSVVAVTYTEDEIIHLDIDGDRFTFEIGSDDDEYIFHGVGRSFVIPLMDDAEGSAASFTSL